MYVVATAGHVDHGKSTLVRALTAMEPDRWAEEKRRGLTIDLGFAWTVLAPVDSGAAGASATAEEGRDGQLEVAFVDVPGHERFIANMLAGLGPAPTVMFVVAADEGWQEQSSDHRDIIAALGIDRGIIALTRCDRASRQRRAEVAAQVRQELAATALSDAPLVNVSAVTGEGLDAVRLALAQVLSASPPPQPHAPVRLWIDRAFSVKGAGTVVTGTLQSGTLTVGDELDLQGFGRVHIRGLHSQNEEKQRVGPVTRVALNLRGCSVDEVARGDVLTATGTWPPRSVIDVRRTTGNRLDQVPEHLVVHIGTTAVEARVRPLGDNHARLTLARALPLALGDKLVLRAPGSSHVLCGLTAVDVDPPALLRRGDGARRAAELAGAAVNSADASPVARLRREGAMRVDDLLALGLDTSHMPAGVVAFRGWWIHASQVTAWKKQLLAALRDHSARQPLSPGLSTGAAIKALGLPDPGLLDLAVAAAKVTSQGGVVAAPAGDLGPAEAGLSKLEAKLKDNPFAAPEALELKAWGLGPKELAAAERAGRVVRLGNNVVVVGASVSAAISTLRALDGPFTVSDARQALGTTRRVVVPLLEYLDRQRLTRRLDNTTREVI